MNPINKAISIIGGPSKVSRELHVTPQAVCFWRDGKRTVPAEHCPVIERLTDAEIRCEDLRPDVDWGYLRGTSIASTTNKEAA